MAQKFLTSIDLSQNELQNARIQNLATAPASPVAGQIYFNTSDSTFKYFDGTDWITVQDGDITAVTAGQGLSGGGTDGDVTLSALVDGTSIEIDATGALSLTPTGVASGSYGSDTEVPVVTVDEDGRVTDISTSSIVTSFDISGDDAATDTVSGGETLIFTGGAAANISTEISDNTVAFDLTDTGVIPGSYGGLDPATMAYTIPSFDVDGKGRISSAGWVNLLGINVLLDSGPVLSYELSNDLLVTGVDGVRTENQSGSIVIGLNDSGVLPDTYGGAGPTGFTVPQLVINDKGIVVGALNAALLIGGTSDEIEVTDLGTGTYTIGLPDNVTITNDLTVSGNLTVSGTQTIVNTEVIQLADNIITLNSNATGTPTENAGIEVNRGDEPTASLVWNESTDKWEISNGVVSQEIAVVSDISANSYAETISGDTSTTSFFVAHPATFIPASIFDIMVQVIDLSTAETVFVQTTRAVGGVSITFDQAPGVGNDYRVLVTKIG